MRYSAFVMLLAREGHCPLSLQGVTYHALRTDGKTGIVTLLGVGKLYFYVSAHTNERGEYTVEIERM